MGHIPLPDRRHCSQRAPIHLAVTLSPTRRAEAPTESNPWIGMWQSLLEGVRSVPGDKGTTLEVLWT